MGPGASELLGLCWGVQRTVRVWGLGFRESRKTQIQQQAARPEEHTKRLRLNPETIWACQNKRSSTSNVRMVVCFADMFQGNYASEWVSGYASGYASRCLGHTIVDAVCADHGPSWRPWLINFIFLEANMTVVCKQSSESINGLHTYHVCQELGFCLRLSCFFLLAQPFTT